MSSFESFVWLGKIGLVRVRHADLASLDREQLGGFFFPHKKSLHPFAQLRPRLWSNRKGLVGWGLTPLRLIVPLIYQNKTQFGTVSAIRAEAEALGRVRKNGFATTSG